MRHPNQTLLLKRLERLIVQTQDLRHSPAALDQQTEIEYALKCLGRFADTVLAGSLVFGAETWHGIHEEADLSAPAEMLLRLKNRDGESLPPFPAVMAMYENGLAPLFDTVLCLAAFREFKAFGHKQVSINISSQSLRDPDFIRCVLPTLEALSLREDEKIIFEIHESTANLAMNPLILKMFRKSGIAFAIDDVGLSMQDVFRMSEFQDIADYIKIDRHSVMADQRSSNAMHKVLSFVSSTLPNAKIIAEGVQDISHAYQLSQSYPGLHYVQGLYLPRRQEFKTQWQRITKRGGLRGQKDISERFDMAASHATK